MLRISSLVIALTINANFTFPPPLTLTDEQLTAKSPPQQYAAETEHLMNIIVESLYTDRDVFLRELVSNSNDAIEKDRLRRLKAGEVVDKEYYYIKIVLDDNNNRILIEDNGCGMSENDLKTQLGSVASSGTRNAIKHLKSESVHDLNNFIGQFGVGFYSSFLVAERVIVHSKSVEEKNEYIWISVGKSQFVTSEAEGEAKSLNHTDHGTVVELALRKSERQRYLEKATVLDILRKFDSFVHFPIYFGEIGKELERVNDKKPLWLRSSNELSAEDYNEFYKTTFKQKKDPFAYSHFKAEGDTEFTGLIYIPARQTEDVFNDLDKINSSNFQLYVQRVLINHELSNFVPPYLNFVYGVLDAQHLPLKVDREGLTSSKVLKQLKNKVVKKIFDLLKDLSRKSDEELPSYEAAIANDEDVTSFKAYHLYNKIWRVYGENMAVGCTQENQSKMRGKILDVYRFMTTKSNGHHYSLHYYIDRMKKQQKAIYYMNANDSRNLSNPLVEVFLKNDVEVLVLQNSFDEGCLSRAQEFNKLPLKSIEKNDFDMEEIVSLSASTNEELLEETKRRLSEYNALKSMYKPLINKAKLVLGSTKTTDVTVSNRLVTSPSIVTVPFHGFTSTYEKMLKSQMGKNEDMVNMISRLKTFEINPRHPLIRHLLTKVEEDQTDEFVSRAIELLYEAGLLQAGFPLTDSHLIVDNLFSGLLSEAGVTDFNYNVEIPENAWESDLESEFESVSESTDEESIDFVNDEF